MKPALHLWLNASKPKRRQPQPRITFQPFTTAKIGGHLITILDNGEILNTPNQNP